MGNLQHPTETIITKIATFKKRQFQNALRDGHIDAHEREEIELTELIYELAVQTNERRQLADHIERGGDPSAYMNRMAARVGMKIVHLEEHRGRVVAFPTQQQHG